MNNNKNISNGHIQTETLDKIASEVYGTPASGVTLVKENLYLLQGLLENLSAISAAVVLQETIQLLEQNPDYLKGQSPDAVHNLAMEASQRKLHDLALRVLEIGKKIFPNNVDINCDLLQLYYTHYLDKYKAEKVWKDLQSIDPNIRGKEWRYWVFGAIYHHRIHNDIKKAQELLQDGIGSVEPEHRHQVLGTLATVYADWDPRPDLEKAIEILEKGLSEGIEYSYEVAMKIGMLKQRLAGRASTTDERNRYLEEALDWLDTAEALFASGIQRPVVYIYKARVNVLMGLRRYSEAISYIAAILAQDEDAVKEGSLRAQLRLACERNGEMEKYRDIEEELSGQHQMYGLLEKLSQQHKGEIALTRSFEPRAEITGLADERRDSTQE